MVISQTALTLTCSAGAWTSIDLMLHMSLQHQQHESDRAQEVVLVAMLQRGVKVQPKVEVSPKASDLAWSHL
jgi:hypothetical protein